MIMNKRKPVPGYRLLPSPSTKLKLKDNHPVYENYIQINQVDSIGFKILHDS